MTTRAVVMCGGGHGAYDIVRTLGRAGVASAVFVSQRDDIAFHSRYVRERVLLPEFREWNFDEILRIVGEFGSTCDERPVLFYSGDSETAFLSRHREMLGRHYRFLLPPQNVTEAVVSKARFVDFARRTQLPVPWTRVFADAAALAACADTLPLPCIVKPEFNQDWFWETHELRRHFGEYKSALRRFDSAESVRAFCARLPRSRNPLLAQAYIDGSDADLVSFHGYIDAASRCLGQFLTRDIRKNPPGTGDTTYCETIRDDALSSMSEACLARIGFRGIVKIDYKWDAAARAYRMLEIEPHYQTAHLLGAFGGVNLPLLAYRDARGEGRCAVDACGETPRAAGLVGPARRLLDLRQDVKSYWHGYRRTGEWRLARYILSLLRRHTHHRLVDVRDPAPFMRSTASYLLSRLRWPSRAERRARDTEAGTTAHPTLENGVIPIGRG